MEGETSEKPQTGGTGRHKVNGAADGVPFSKENQPSPEAKSKGWDRKRVGKELAAQILSLKFKGANNSPLLKNIASYFGVKEKDITVEMMMMFRQAEKAISKSDTFAFNAFMDRAHGKAKMDITTNGKDINTPPPPGSNIDYTQLPDEVLEAIVKARKPIEE